MLPLTVFTSIAAITTNVLRESLLFFTEAGAFAFGSGLAIVPYLYEGRSGTPVVD